MLCTQGDCVQWMSFDTLKKKKEHISTTKQKKFSSFRHLAQNKLECCPDHCLVHGGDCLKQHCLLKVVVFFWKW